jgi:hypothetical protein
MCIVMGIGHVRTFGVCTSILPVALYVKIVVGQNSMCPPVKTEVMEVVVVHLEVVEVKERDLVVVELVVMDFEAAGVGGLDFEAKIVVDLEVEAAMNLEVEAGVNIKVLGGLKATDLEEVQLKKGSLLITIIIIIKCSNCQKTCPECDYNSQDIYFFSNPCIRKAYLFNLNFLCCPNCVYNSKKKSRFQVNLFMKESDTIAPFVIRYFNLKMI